MSSSFWQKNTAINKKENEGNFTFEFPNRFSSRLEVVEMIFSDIRKP